MRSFPASPRRETCCCLARGVQWLNVRPQGASVATCHDRRLHLPCTLCRMRRRVRACRLAACNMTNSIDRALMHPVVRTPAGCGGGLGPAGALGAQPAGAGRRHGRAACHAGGSAGGMDQRGSWVCAVLRPGVAAGNPSAGTPAAVERAASHPGPSPACPCSATSCREGRSACGTPCRRWRSARWRPCGAWRRRSRRARRRRCATWSAEQVARSSWGEAGPVGAPPLSQPNPSLACCLRASPSSLLLQVGTAQWYAFLHQTVSELAGVPAAELALPLFLLCALSASEEAALEATAYEFFEQASPGLYLCRVGPQLPPACASSTACLYWAVSSLRPPPQRHLLPAFLPINRNLAAPAGLRPVRRGHP